MCGIAGILNLDASLSPRQMRALGEAMAARLAHRGPDDAGVWVSDDNHCMLAHRRLSILDVSPAGRQPMAGPGGVLTFNGEIYNYLELKAGMDGAFATRTDTEVLLRLLAERGAEALGCLDGMFAFGFYRPDSRTLLLARDPFGEKPLYTTHQNGVFAFASELSALTELPGFDDRIAFADIAGYLSLQYVRAPQAIYRSCAKLAPGCHMVVTPSGPQPPQAYWRFATGGDQHGPASLDEQADRLEDILTRALERRLRCDVPLGLFLSGGVDSATVAALASKRLNRQVRTFSIGFPHTDETEHHQAREIAAHLGCEHFERLVPQGRMGLVDVIADALDEPNADSSCLPTWLLCQYARQHVTVAVSGDGGDEMFGGYRRYFECQERMEANAEGVAAGSWNVGWDYVSSRLLIYVDRDLRRLIGPLPDELTGWLDGLRRDITDDRRPLVNVLREVDAANYLPGAVLTKVDRMSMAHGLEVRTPFLSPELAAFAAGLPADRISRGHDGKLVLKHLARRYLPAEWLARPKRGFGLPVVTWGAEDFLRRTLLDRLGDSPLGQWLDLKRVRDCVEGQSPALSLYQLWAVVLLDRWLRSHPARPA